MASFGVAANAESVRTMRFELFCALLCRSQPPWLQDEDADVASEGEEDDDEEGDDEEESEQSALNVEEVCG